MGHPVTLGSYRELDVERDNLLKDSSTRLCPDTRKLCIYLTDSLTLTLIPVNLQEAVML